MTVGEVREPSGLKGGPGAGTGRTGTASADPRTPPAQSKRTCPECGSDTYLAAQTRRLLNARDRAERRAGEIARENGLLRAQVAWAREDRAEQVRGLQRKARKQADVIRRLERRLREQGVRPHDDVDYTETVAQNGVDPV